eukprot:g2869.t1
MSDIHGDDDPELANATITSTPGAPASSPSTSPITHGELDVSSVSGSSHFASTNDFSDDVDSMFKPLNPCEGVEGSGVAGSIAALSEQGHGYWNNSADDHGCPDAGRGTPTNSTDQSGDNLGRGSTGGTGDEVGIAPALLAAEMTAPPPPPPATVDAQRDATSVSDAPLARNPDVEQLVSLSCKSYKTCSYVLEQCNGDIEMAAMKFFDPGFVDPFPGESKEGANFDDDAASLDTVEPEDKDKDTVLEGLKGIRKALPTVLVRDTAPILRDLVDRFEGTVRQSANIEGGSTPPRDGKSSSHEDSAELAKVMVPDPLSLPQELSFLKECLPRIVSGVLSKTFATPDLSALAMQTLESCVRLAVIHINCGDDSPDSLIPMLASICVGFNHAFYKGKSVSTWSNSLYRNVTSREGGNPNARKHLFSLLIECGGINALLGLACGGQGSIEEQEYVRQKTLERRQKLEKAINGDESQGGEDNEAPIEERKWIGTEKTGKILNLIGRACKDKLLGTDMMDEAADRFMKRLESLSDSQMRINRKDNEKSLEPLFDGLDQCCKHRPGKMEPFWMEKVDLRFFRSNNLHQRMYALGEFKWYSQKRADLVHVPGYLTNARYIKFIREAGIIEDLYEPPRMNLQVLQKAWPVVEYIVNCRRRGGKINTTSGPLPFAWEKDWLCIMFENASSQGDMALAEEVYAAIALITAIFLSDGGGGDREAAARAEARGEVWDEGGGGGVPSEFLGRNARPQPIFYEMVKKLFEKGNALLSQIISLKKSNLQDTDEITVSTLNPAPATPPRSGDALVITPTRKRKKYVPVKDLRYITTFLQQWERRESDMQIVKCAERCPMVHAEALKLGWDTMWFLNDPEASWLVDFCVKLINAFPEKDAKQRSSYFSDCWRHIEGKNSSNSSNATGEEMVALEAELNTRSAINKGNRASCIAYKVMQKLLSQKNPFEYGSKSIDWIDEWSRNEKGYDGKDGIVGYVAKETIMSFPFLQAAATQEQQTTNNLEKQDIVLAENALKARLEFMLYVASRKEDLYITESTLKSLFVTFGACDTLLSWFNELLPTSSMSYMPSVEKETLRFIFTELVCGSIRPSSCSSSGFSCFRYFFLHRLINGNAISTEYHRPSEIRQVKGRDWTGKEFLWGCILSAENDSVAREARNLYLRLVKNMSVSAGLREERDEGLAVIFEKLALATQSLMRKDNDGERPRDLSLNERDSLRVCTLAMRLLSSLVLDCMMKSPTAIKQIRAAASDPNSRMNRHGSRGRGSPIKLRVYVEKLYTSCPSSNFDIDVHGKITLRRLIKMINDRPECTPLITSHSNVSSYKIKKLRHRTAGTFEDAEDELRVLEELGFRDGDAVTCNWEYVYTGSHHTTSHVNYTGYTNGIGVNNTLYEIENDDDISVLDRKQGALRSLVHLDEHMNVLFTLVQTMTRLSAQLFSNAEGIHATKTNNSQFEHTTSDRERCDLIAAEGWAFLQSLPTHIPTDALFRSLVPSSSSASDLGKRPSFTPSSWGELLSSAPNDFVQTSYRLQIVDALLLPADKIESKLDETAKSWRREFLATGGFKAILDILFMRTSTVEPSGGTYSSFSLRNTVRNPVTNTCFAVALRIAKFCLLGGLVGRGVDLGVQSTVQAEGSKANLSLVRTADHSKENTDQITWANEDAILKIEAGDNETSTSDTKSTRQEITTHKPADEFVIPKLVPGTSDDEAMRVAFPPLMRSFSESSTSRTLDNIDLALVLQRLILVVANVFPVLNEESIGEDTSLGQHCKCITRVDLHKRREMALNCLVMMRGILKSSSNMIAEFLSPSHKGDSIKMAGGSALVPLLLYSKDHRLREGIFELFIEVAENTPTTLLNHLFAPMQRNFGRLSNRRPNDPTQFFMLFEKMLRHVRKLKQSTETKKVSENQLNCLFDPSSMLEVLITRIKDYNPSDEEHVLTGYLRLVRTVVEGDSKLDALPVPFQMIEDLLDLLFEVCLFNVPTISSRNTTALCTSRAARRAVFDVFRCLAEKSVDIRAVILERVESFRMTVRAHFEKTTKVSDSQLAFPLATDEDLTKNLDRNITGFVGLKNQGATCYMNATLQVLNLDPVFRYLVHMVDSKSLMRKIVEKKTNGPTSSTSAGRGEEKEDPYSDEAITKDADASKFLVLSELQRCLLYLQEGRMHYYDARPLVIASKSLNLLNDVLHQNDVRDYADKLMDRLEDALTQQDSTINEFKGQERLNNTESEKANENTPDSGTKKVGPLQKLFNSRFKGIWATETHRLGDNIPEEHAVSSRTEPFFALAATIKNHSGGVGGKQPFFTDLEESLADSVKGERMEGENQLDCDFLPRGDDGKYVKCNGVRRMFIEKLPDVMLVHLKRFEYDVSTYNIAKVKQKFKFPMSLNMFRYTRAGVAAAVEEDGKEEHDDKKVDTMKNANEIPSKEEQPGGESKVKADDKSMRSAKVSKDNTAISSDPEFDYELVGVVVHNGASEQSGHYYSYALVPPDKDRTNLSHQHGIEAGDSESFSMNGTGKWFKFNDKSVTPFDPSIGAESEWFGGKSHVPVINQYTGEPIGNSTRLEFRNNSAYMLVYRRKNNSISLDSAYESNSEITRSALNMLEGHTLTTGQEVQTSEEQFRLLSQIWHENDLAIRTRWLFDPEFFSFMRDILVMAASSTDGNEDDASKMTSIIKVAVEFFVNVVIKGKDKSDLKRWVEVIASLLISSPAAAAHILESASSRIYVQEKIIRQSLPELREVFSDLCLSAIKALVPLNDSISDVVESKEAKSASNKDGDPSDTLSPEGQMLLDIMIADPEDTPTSIINGVSCEDIISKCQSAESSKESEATDVVTTEIQKGLEKTHYTAGESTSHYVLLVARFVRILFQELQDHIHLVNESNWRRFGEFFRLLRGCAKLRTVRAYMVRIGFQNALLGFYAGTLPGMQSWSLTIKNPQYGTADFEHLLGAVANLCCAPDALRFLNMPMLLTGEHILRAKSGKGGDIHSKPEDTSDYRVPARVKILKRLAKICGQKLVEQTLGGPSVDESSGDTVYGWHPEIKQSNENWFAARTIVYATPAVSPGLVTEARLRIGQLKRVDRQEKGILGLGVFQQVSDIVGGVSDQEGHDDDDVIYRIIYDKGEVDQFVRACFVEECAGEPPRNRFALKLLASRDLEVIADGPNMVDPNEVGDIVHRCTKSEECPGLSISVKHFDSIDALETSRDLVKAENARIIKDRHRATSESAKESLDDNVDDFDNSSNSPVSANELELQTSNSTPNVIESYMSVETQRDEGLGEEKIGVGECDTQYDPAGYSRLTRFGPGDSV